LVEILVAAVITVVLVAILLQITSLAGTTVSLSTQKLSAFQSARTAFDIMTRNLSQATLNTYLDYYNSSGQRRTDTNSDANNNGATANFQPVCYGRASDLQFVIQANQINPNCGQEVYFQAPRSYSADANLQSVQGLLNACGYYVQFGNASLFQPSTVSTAKYRYRLMQGMEPTENLAVFTATALSGTGSTTDNSTTWLTNIYNGSGQNSVYVTPLADNVIALIIWPRLSFNDDPTGDKLLLNPQGGATDSYSYDSQWNVAPNTAAPYDQKITADQLPPDVQVTMVVLDEASALRAQGTSTVQPTVITSALAGRFLTADNYQADLTGLANQLTAAHLNFQIFNTTVAMRESKWSTPQ
jgi:uncharacterized protein (TIGR02599 family)